MLPNDFPLFFGKKWKYMLFENEFILFFIVACDLCAISFMGKFAVLENECYSFLYKRNL